MISRRKSVQQLLGVQKALNFNSTQHLNAGLFGARLLNFAHFPWRCNPRLEFLVESEIWGVLLSSFLACSLTFVLS